MLFYPELADSVNRVSLFQLHHTYWLRSSDKAVWFATGLTDMSRKIILCYDIYRKILIVFYNWIGYR